MEDFSWEDFEMDDDELFGKQKGIEKGLTKIQRLIFIHDCERYPMQPIPLGPQEFIDLFDEPTTEDLEILTQLLIKDVHAFTHNQVIDKWGLEWMQYILDFNVEVEEYELCATFKEIIDEEFKTI